MRQRITSAERVGITKGRKEGLQEGLSKGKQQGLIEGKLEVAKNLLSKGVDPKIIEESTKLPHSKIEELKKQVLH